ncbi:probable RNA methyltransferase at5g51130 [Phtheirospermum japonicum]|uniref:RNA methyltransferase n=1 Tax=Phtheirospermum japonicum TaxID=374723 RepID=A0A830BBX1_9LAMI|nr:probable RNA methyltransferase at5g51130 [Phtheirospermum japonicum]
MMFVALILDPFNKLRGVQVAINGIFEQENADNLVRKVKDFAYELFDEYRSLYAPLSSASGESFSRPSIIEDDENSSCLWEMIGLVGVRNIMLCKKPKIENCDVGENSTIVAALSRKGKSVITKVGQEKKIDAAKAAKKRNQVKSKSVHLRSRPDRYIPVRFTVQCLSKFQSTDPTRNWFFRSGPCMQTPIHTHGVTKSFQKGKASQKQINKNCKMKKNNNEKKRELPKESAACIDRPQPPKKKNRKEVAIFGNYRNYYGYRVGQDLDEDPRLKMMKKEWFEGKDCLDIGCNSGLMTISLAKKFGCRSILGIDIDGARIEDAHWTLRKVIKTSTHRGPSKIQKPADVELTSSLEKSTESLTDEKGDDSGCSDLLKIVSFQKGNFVQGWCPPENTYYHAILWVAFSLWNLSPGARTITTVLCLRDYSWDIDYFECIDICAIIVQTATTNYKNIQISPEDFQDILLDKKSAIRAAPLLRLSAEATRSSGGSRQLPAATDGDVHPQAWLICYSNFRNRSDPSPSIDRTVVARQTALAIQRGVAPSGSRGPLGLAKFQMMNNMQSINQAEVAPEGHPAVTTNHRFAFPMNFGYNINNNDLIHAWGLNMQLGYCVQASWGL